LERRETNWMMTESEFVVEQQFEPPIDPNILEPEWMNNFIDSREFEQIFSFSAEEEEDLSPPTSTFTDQQENVSGQEEEKLQNSQPIRDHYQPPAIPLLHQQPSIPLVPNVSQNQHPLLFVHQQNQRKKVPPSGRKAPTAKRPTKEETSISSRQSTPEEDQQSFPDQASYLKYLKRRQSNNVSASKSRLKKKIQEQVNFERTKILEEENTRLRVELEKLSHEAKYLRELLTSIINSKK